MLIELGQLHPQHAEKIRQPERRPRDERLPDELRVIVTLPRTLRIRAVNALALEMHAHRALVRVDIDVTAVSEHIPIGQRDPIDIHRVRRRRIRPTSHSRPRHKRHQHTSRNDRHEYQGRAPHADTAFNVEPKRRRNCSTPFTVTRTCGASTTRSPVAGW